MRKDGRGHGDHDRDRGPTWIGAALFVIVVAIGGWVLAGAPWL